MSEPVRVIKQNTRREETWRYDGQILRRWPNAVLLEAAFNREDMPFHGMTFGKGDRFIEIYYTDRWYNIYEIHDREDDHLKGWYCNVSLPAEISENQIAYVDLALDLLVFPDGRQLVLDEKEFVALALPPDTQSHALIALGDLREIFRPPVLIRLAGVALD